MRQILVSVLQNQIVGWEVESNYKMTAEIFFFFFPATKFKKSLRIQC